MKNTTAWQIPYPESGDHTRTWEYWQALAERVDACLTTQQNPAVLRMSRTNQSIATTAVATVAYTTKTQDTDGMANAGGDTFTIKTAGIWLASVFGYWAVNSTGMRQLLITLNGADVAGQSIPAHTAAGITTRMNGAAIFAAALNDTIQVNAFQNSGAALNLTSYLNMIWLRP